MPTQTVGPADAKPAANAASARAANPVGFRKKGVAKLVLAGFAAIVASVASACFVGCAAQGGDAQRSAREVQLPNAVKLQLQPIPAGTFVMGSPESEAVRSSDEKQHTVTISRPFWLGTYEVTQAQWKAVMGDNPSHFKGDDSLPVESVLWDEAKEFCDRLTSQERGAGRLPEGYVYRLPTEAEWEYSCRAGTTTPFSFGSVLNGREANCDGKYPYGTETKGPYLGKTTRVGSYSPNAWGLYDMHGNVWEWCHDWDGNYPSGSVTDPTGAASGRDRVLRGGCLLDSARSCCSANRGSGGPGYRYYVIGFRVALAPAVR